MTQKYQVKVSMNQAAIVKTGLVLKQGDFGMQVEIEVLDFDVSNTTPQIVFRKLQGAVEATTITVSNNKYTYTFRGTELDIPGRVICDLKLKNSTTQRISSASFAFEVVPDTLDGLAEEASSYSDTVEQIAEKWESTFEGTLDAIDREKTGFSKTNFGVPANLLNVSKLLYGAFIKGSTGEVEKGTSGTGLNCCTEEYMPVDPETSYYIFPGSLYCNLVMYDASKSRISSQIASKEFTTSATAAYIRMSFRDSEITQYSSVSRVKAANNYVPTIKRVRIDGPKIDTETMTLRTKTSSAPYDSSSSTTRCMTSLIWLENVRIKKSGSNYAAAYIYDQNMEFEASYNFDYFSTHDYIYINEGRYCIFVFAFSDTREISTSDFATLAGMISFEKLTFDNLNSILSDRISRGQIGFSTTNFTKAPNIIDVKKLHYGAFINGSSGEIQEGVSGTGLNCCTDEYMAVEASTTYFCYAISYCNIVMYDANKTRLNATTTDTNSFQTSSDTVYVRMSFRSSEVTDTLSVSKIWGPSEYIASTKNVRIGKPEINTNSMILGTKSSAHPYEYGNSTNRCMTGMIWLENVRIRKTGSNKMATYLFDKTVTSDSVQTFIYWSSNNYLDINEGRYCVFVFAFSDDQTISTSDFATLAGMVSFEYPTVKEIANIQETSENVVSRTTWRNGSVANTLNQYAVAFKNIMANNYATSVTFLINKPLDTGHKYRYQFTTYSINSGTTEDHNAQRITIDKTILIDKNICTFELNDNSKGFAVAIYEKDENDDYIELRIDSFDTSQIFILRNYDTSGNIQNYSFGPDLIKKPLSVKPIGSLSAHQSFCMYNGNYYSTEGTKLYEQNSSFELISTTEMNLGHGNGLQVGTGGMAYASGWDDGNVYVVDLANKTIINTIELPVTGYTTCAVDDINGIIYIFQRETRPNTRANYNFIVYDYINETILSTKKTTKSFGAMQACDFVDGRIYVLHGIGTDDLPNGYTVYDTKGDILAEYVLGIFESTEPEGVYVDRETHELYISLVSKELYKISSYY